MAKKQVIISFKTTPLIFDINEIKFCKELFGKINTNENPKHIPRNRRRYRQ